MWEAEDRVQHARVAVKVLHADLAGDETRRARFFRGARVMSELRHASIARVLAPEELDGGFHYFVMELLTGGDLASAVMTGKVPKDRVVPLILKIGEALTFAHEQVDGFIHRDVKPPNILLDEEGNPKLSDFDLVAAKDTTGGTRTGAMGSFLYAAPELLSRPQEADHRADVFGLGMTALFCLHGEPLTDEAFFEPQKTEVTVAAYYACVREKKCSYPFLQGEVCSEPNGEMLDHPVDCVADSQAEHYCEVIGGRVPTEAEWEFAAHGPEERLYPWGAETAGISKRFCGRASARFLPARSTCAVGRFPEGASPFGLLDMAGNVDLLAFVASETFDTHRGGLGAEPLEIQSMAISSVCGPCGRALGLGRPSSLRPITTPRRTFLHPHPETSNGSVSLLCAQTRQPEKDVAQTDACGPAVRRAGQALRGWA